MIVGCRDSPFSLPSPLPGNPRSLVAGLEYPGLHPHKSFIARWHIPRPHVVNFREPGDTALFLSTDLNTIVKPPPPASTAVFPTSITFAMAGVTRERWNARDRSFVDTPLGVRDGHKERTNYELI